MTTRFQTSVRYEHPPDSVLALLIDPAYYLDLAVHLDPERGPLTQARREDPSKGEIVITVDQWEKAVFRGGETRRTMTFHVDLSTRSARWTQRIHGLEGWARVEGTCAVIAQPQGGCELRTRGEIELRVPVVSKTIERRVVRRLESNSKLEAAFTRARLDGDTSSR